MQHENHSHTGGQPSLAVHLIMLGVVLLVLGGLYLLFQSAASLGLGLLALGIVIAVLTLSRGFLRDALIKMHTPPAADKRDAQGNLKTEGLTINWASTYDWLVGFLFFGGEKKLREAFVRLARIRPGDKVLDVGCGTGTQAIIASLKSDPSVQVYGIDAAPEMIAKARQKAARAGAKVDFKPGLVEAIDFPAASLDVVMNSFMVHHLPGELKRKAFAEIYRVLKPGGRLLIIDFEPPKGGLTRAFLTMLLGQGMLTIDNSQVPPLLQAAGFVSVKSGNAGHKLATYMLGEKPR
jgi:demethylmenaquinone methyltransferase/2-methoxy-6-polyprenyl-1,4-benzoquinol methylase/phosphoethanolamine N-methyltransferase